MSSALLSLHCQNDNYISIPGSTNEQSLTSNMLFTYANQAEILSEEELEYLTSESDGVKPFLRKSLFSNVPHTIIFYNNGIVKKPSANHRKLLTWSKDKLLPLVMRQTLAISYFRIVDNSKPWSGFWGRHLRSPEFRTIEAYQKVNHFSGGYHLIRKDRLWQHISELMERMGEKKTEIMPQSFILPKERNLVQEYFLMHDAQPLILKPPSSTRGSGITVVSKFSDIPPETPLVAQKYILNPMLIDGYKFDLRFYVYVTSLDPLRIYLFEDGLVRFASVPYSNSFDTLSNIYVHLTNYSINKMSQESGASNEPVKKWRLNQFWNRIDEKKREILKKDIEELAVKALIACESFIRENQNTKYSFVSHELFGMDVMIDNDLKPWLLEMNVTPSLHSSTAVDASVKSKLASNVLTTCGITFPIIRNEFESSLCYRVKNYFCHKSMVHLEKEAEHVKYYIKHGKISKKILDTLTDADVRCLIEFEDELMRCDGLKLIFPKGKLTEHLLENFCATIYSNLLLTAWQKFQEFNGRKVGISRLEKLCKEGFHIVKNPRPLTRDKKHKKENRLKIKFFKLNKDTSCGDITDDTNEENQETVKSTL